MADLQRKTAQLFDISARDTTKGYINQARLNGSTVEANGAWKISEYIEVEGSTTYTLSGLKTDQWYNSSLVFYDSSYEPLQYNKYQNLVAISPTSPSNAKYVRLSFQEDTELMLCKGSAAKPYEPYGWVHSLRKLTTASETIQSGDTIYANGQPITIYNIKGNEEHTGTPSPQNPVMPNGVGNKTANLCFKTLDQCSINASGEIVEYSGFVVNIAKVTQGTNYSGFGFVYAFYATEPQIGSVAYDNQRAVGDLLNVTAPIDGYVAIRANDTANSNMINTGSTVKPQEPYGYKIPISSGQQTIDIYIGDLPLLKSLDGTAVDEISNGTLTRRVDSDGSVLPTPTTTQITMPSIPTTDGANTITVDTTVQPSEFSATWTGWHDASVKEWDGSDWQ